MPAICFEWKRPITSHGGSLTSEASIYIKLKKKKKLRLVQVCHLPLWRVVADCDLQIWTVIACRGMGTEGIHSSFVRAL